jgi:hypothetical protein
MMAVITQKQKIVLAVILSTLLFNPFDMVGNDTFLGTADKAFVFFFSQILDSSKQFPEILMRHMITRQDPGCRIGALWSQNDFLTVQHPKRSLLSHIP